MAKIATKAAPKTTAAKKKPAAKKVVAPVNQKAENVEAPIPVVEQEVNTGNEVLETPTKKNPICVVMPYVHSSAKGDELLYALRSLDKNFEEEFVVILVGDKPDFVSDDVLHIPSLELQPNPQLDMAAKLMQIIASDLVEIDFVLTNDDIYFVNKVSLADLKVPRISGDLGETKLKAGSGYTEKILATKAALEAAKLPTKDYATHLPVVYDKFELAAVIQRFEADKKGLLISSLYFNKVSLAQPAELTKGGPTGDHVVYIYRENPNLDVVKHGFEHRKFVNHNNAGYEPTLPFLKKAFPAKSRFEK